MDEKLIEILRTIGKETASLNAPDGSQLLVLPYGGRILGLYASGDSRNFLWTNPALHAVESARKFYDSEGWQNSGGDRTWISPEVVFFLPNFPQLDAYHQPRELDPGSFSVEKHEDVIHLRMEFTMADRRRAHPVALRMMKSVRMAADPLRHESAPRWLKGIQFARYSLHTSLEIMDKPADALQIGLWSLLQMPHGGEMLLPTYGDGTARLLRRRSCR